MESEHQIRLQYRRLHPSFDERARREWAAADARAARVTSSESKTALERERAIGQVAALDNAVKDGIAARERVERDLSAALAREPGRSGIMRRWRPNRIHWSRPWRPKSPEIGSTKQRSTRGPAARHDQ